MSAVAPLIMLTPPGFGSKILGPISFPQSPYNRWDTTYSSDQIEIGIEVELKRYELQRYVPLQRLHVWRQHAVLR